jgi:hypothetical protein
VGGKLVTIGNHVVTLGYQNNCWAGNHVGTIGYHLVTRIAYVSVIEAAIGYV